MPVAFLSPLPPARTGVAHYAAMVLPALLREIEVRAFDSADGYRREEFDGFIYQLGNNPHHEFVYAEAMANPGVAVLHDVVLHHLIVETTLARGDEEGYVAALRASHGAAGVAWARGRAAGLHSEMGNFLLPASVELARRSRAVVVHNRWAADVLRSFGVETPIHVVPHPYEPQQGSADGPSVRRRLGFGGEDRVVGLFGFLTSAKRAEVVVGAFRLARQRDSRLRLLIVGEPAPNIDMSAIAGPGVIATGYVADEDFGAYYAAADRLVNLRYPSAGETSGTLIRAFAAGKPVAVSEYAQFAELPDSCVTKIPFGPDETGRLADFFRRDLDVTAIASAQREWLEQNARIEKTVEGYLAALRHPPSAAAVAGPARAERSPIALFPNVTVAGAELRENEFLLTLRNDGDTTIAGPLYGQPAYRVVVKIFQRGREQQSRWVPLPGDLLPGGSVTVSVPLYLEGSPAAVAIMHALEGIPIVEVATAESVVV